ncbi:ABC transporter ATP-binding protein/permease [Campylobacter curvus]|uniref:ABC transporter ATP-binding protein/permease n=1 Tax=Campylobacter curvus TaxID=200 RepID=UPI00037BFF63|nr:ABC transporter ATP-binding protein/permease [Campylobacter curvus]QKF61855.1 ABC transporter, ATP-binding protein [Campylobacter curvus]UEB50144.1 ABC transporter ATP-binding protein/permease [Campylobacter curvus]
MDTLKHFFEIISWYWFKKDAIKAWLMLALTLGFSLAIVKVATLMNAWDKKFYDALSNFQKELILPLVGEFLIYTAFIVLFIVLGSWFKKLLVISWRESLSDKMENLWLQNANFYRLSQNESFDNPDQRIAEDSLLLADMSINLVKSLVYNLSKLVAFTAILWEASKVVNFTLFGYDITMSGFLVYIAVIYTLVCSLITHLIGKNLKGLNYEKQQVEANYRANLLITRENAEAVAFLKGSKAEKERFRGGFLDIVKNWRVIMNTEFRLECFSASYLKITNLIPIFASLPLYFARTMSFGDMMQARSAFYSVQDGLAWFMDYYKQIMTCAASVERIYKFTHATQQSHKILEFNHTQNSVKCENLEVRTPNQKVLTSGLNFTLTPGKWLVLSGKSGAGKSSVFRYLAGIWEFGNGLVAMPRDGVMFLPQKPYLAKMSLKALIAYPQDPSDEDAKFERILERVGLAKFKSDLNERKDYAKILSGGEAQRVGFARIYFHEPKILFMDEATSALDSPSARELLINLKADFNELGVLAILHQEELKDIFDEAIKIK